MRRKDGKPQMPRGILFDKESFEKEIYRLSYEKSLGLGKLAAFIGVSYPTLNNARLHGKLCKSKIPLFQAKGIKFEFVK